MLRGDDALLADLRENRDRLAAYRTSELLRLVAALLPIDPVQIELRVRAMLLEHAADHEHASCGVVHTDACELLIGLREVRR